MKKKFCYNCQSGLHGKCSMSWCACPMPECKIGYRPVFVLEEIIAYMITPTPKTLTPERVGIEKLSEEKQKIKGITDTKIIK